MDDVEDHFLWETEQKVKKSIRKHPFARGANSFAGPERIFFSLCLRVFHGSIAII
jgi:hypothetical protein